MQIFEFYCFRERKERLGGRSTFSGISLVRDKQLRASAGLLTEWSPEISAEGKKSDSFISTLPHTCFWSPVPGIPCNQHSAISHFGHGESVHYGSGEAETIYFCVFSSKLEVIFFLCVRQTLVRGCGLLYCIFQLWNQLGPAWFSQSQMFMQIICRHLPLVFLCQNTQCPSTLILISDTIFLLYLP